MSTTMIPLAVAGSLRASLAVFRRRKREHQGGQDGEGRAGDGFMLEGDSDRPVRFGKR